MKVINEQQLLERIKTLRHPFFDEYYAFYSSWFGGIVKDPRFMLVPLDDHMVHRGDGVFETMKAETRGVYQLDEHLQRLFWSAEKIGLQSPCTEPQMKEIILDTLRAADKDSALIRILLARGPGSFSVNPYDAVAPQLYIAVYKLSTPAPEKYEHGVIIGASTIPVKSSWLAQVKSCNYLPNVLMKKESVDRKLDFVIGVDDNGYITESATENIMIIDKNGVLVQPPLDFILKGTTMVRVCELAEVNGLDINVKPITVDDLCNAREVIITGTSLNILPVVKFEDRLISGGKPGEIAKQLSAWMVSDIRNGVKSTGF